MVSVSDFCILSDSKINNLLFSCKHSASHFNSSCWEYFIKMLCIPNIENLICQRKHYPTEAY